MGIPARRLAIRATLSPCSASGIAQPRITSSTSDASRDVTRRSASAITTAAISSGRVYRSAPFGAFPTGVLTADSTKASFMAVWSLADARSLLEIAEQILERLADFRRMAVEQMIGAVDHDQLLRLRQRPVELPHILDRAD